MYHARFSGTHYEAGLHWGSMLAEHGKFIAAQPTFAVSEERKQFARQCLPVYEKYFPEVLEEIRGIADGQQGCFDDFAGFLLSMYAYGFGHCTCIAYADENAAFLGRNCDFLTSLEKLYMNCLYRLGGSYAFNGNTTAFVQMEDGMNERGLAAGLTFVYPKVRAAGLNAGMLVRLLLEKCTAAEEALALLEKVPCASQHTVTVADGGGNIFVAECSPRKLHVIRPQCSRAVAAVNNFFSPEMHALANPPELDDWNAAGRYAAANEMLRAKRLSSADAARILADGRLCGYDRKTGADTVWAAVYDTKNGRIFRAEGNPSRRQFKEDARPLRHGEKFARRVDKGGRTVL